MIYVCFSLGKDRYDSFRSTPLSSTSSQSSVFLSDQVGLNTELDRCPIPKAHYIANNNIHLTPMRDAMFDRYPLCIQRHLMISPYSPISPTHISQYPKQVSEVSYPNSPCTSTIMETSKILCGEASQHSYQHDCLKRSDITSHDYRITSTQNLSHKLTDDYHDSVASYGVLNDLSHPICPTINPTSTPCSLNFIFPHLPIPVQLSMECTKNEKCSPENYRLVNSIDLNASLNTSLCDHTVTSVSSCEIRELR